MHAHKLPASQLHAQHSAVSGCEATLRTSAIILDQAHLAGCWTWLERRPPFKTLSSWQMTSCARSELLNAGNLHACPSKDCISHSAIHQTGRQSVQGSRPASLKIAMW